MTSTSPTSCAWRCFFPLAGRTPAQAVVAFLDPLKAAVHCFTKANLRPSGYQLSKPGSEPHVLLLNNAEPVALAGSELTLEVNQWFRVVAVDGHLGPYKVSTVGYSYIISEAEAERFAFHWHPATGRGFPHVHVASDAQRLHVPTGRIAIEQVLLLVQEMGAEPIDDRWQGIVDDSLRTFEEYRTWAGRPDTTRR